MAKHETIKMIEGLPENSSYEDIQYHLYVLQKIKRAQEDKVNNRVYSHEEVKIIASKWLKN